MAKSIISIQSHVVYGYVGNKAATYPLQAMGFDVWPINTVQFSNHTGYSQWQGDIFCQKHVASLINGLEALGVMEQCNAILSGYMGSEDICLVVAETVKRFKAKNPNLIYVCDPVIGDNGKRYVSEQVLHFFREHMQADIMTPNQFEAEILSDIKITDVISLKAVADYFHHRDIKTVVITGLRLVDYSANYIYTFISDGKNRFLVNNLEYYLLPIISGTGDLFAALYLGNYLLTNDILKALQITVYHIDKVLQQTLKVKAQELQILDVNYRQWQEARLPKYISIMT